MSVVIVEHGQSPVTLPVSALRSFHSPAGGMIDCVDVPLTDPMLDDAGEEIEPLDHGRWRITVRKHAITKGKNVNWLPFARHDINDGVIEQGRDVARTICLAMGHALVAIAFHQSSERRLVAG
ncbi:MULTISPECIES: hypothetical protein [Asaia]|uniref:hypothetical protein n=1 Tax=Asaia TaxID=91914 RepID=UPI002FC3D8EC